MNMRWFMIGNFRSSDAQSPPETFRVQIVFSTHGDLYVNLVLRVCLRPTHFAQQPNNALINSTVVRLCL